MNLSDRPVWVRCICSCGCGRINFWREGWDKRCTACVEKKHEPKV